MDGKSRCGPVRNPLLYTYVFVFMGRDFLVFPPNLLSVLLLRISLIMRAPDELIPRLIYKKVILAVWLCDGLTVWPPSEDTLEPMDKRFDSFDSRTKRHNIASVDR